METKQQQVIDMIVRVMAFLASHPSIEPASYAVPARVLSDSLRQLREYAGEQLSGLTLTKAQQRNAEKLAGKLVDRHIRPLVTIAQASVYDDVPLPPLTLPSGLGFNRLIAFADALADTAQQYEARFVENGRPTDFIAQLRAARAELELALTGRAVQRGRHIGATTGIAVQIRKSRAAVKRIDSLVRIAYEGNEVVLERWKATKRVFALPVSAPAASAPTQAAA